MAYEAMNNAPYLNSRVIVIYNDNGQVRLSPTPPQPIQPRVAARAHAPTRSPTHSPPAPQVSLPTGTPSAGGTAPAGSLSAYTTRLIASKPFQDFRDIAKSINKLFPKEIQEARATSPPATRHPPPAARHPPPATRHPPSPSLP
jgi:1-deoxy-D-xylulose-5-phosphate synthase